MKGRIIIQGEYQSLKAAIKEIDERGRFENRSFNYHDDDRCRVDYFYADYDIAELDYEAVNDNQGITIEQW